MNPLPPLLDPWLWLRWTAAFAVLVVAPGLLWVRLGFPARPPVRARSAYLAVAIGLLLGPVVARLAATLHVPWSPLSHLLGACTLAALLGLTLARWGGASQSRTESVLDPEPAPAPSTRGDAAIVLGVTVTLFVLLLVSFRDFQAPPHLHDASNHAFLTLRIADTQSTAPGDVFGAPYGSHSVRYHAGWHAAAATVARLARVPPYVSTWMLPLVALCGLPWAWWVLWREWGFAPRVAAVAGLFLLANESAPTGLLGWGGFGSLAGLFLVPAQVLLLRSLLLRGGVGSGLAAGLVMGSGFLVHAGSAFVALLLLPATVLTARGSRRPRLSPRAWIAFAAVLLLVVGGDAWSTASSYAATRMHPSTNESVGRSLNGALNALGRWHLLKLALVVGLVHGVRRRALRPVAGTALVVVIWTVLLDAVRDPVSRALAIPLYQEPTRVRAVLMLLLPPLAVQGLWGLRARLASHRGSRWRTRASGITFGLILAALIAPGLPRVYDNLRNSKRFVPFDESDCELAHRLGALVEPGGSVANSWDDGSVWAMHVSGLDFVLPASWHLGVREGWDRRPAVAGLVQRPWPAATLALRDAGVRYVWASDVHLTSPPGSPVTRAALDADPRFTRLDASQGSGVYRIEWDRNGR